VEVAFHPADGDDVETLMQRAEARSRGSDGAGVAVLTAGTWPERGNP
jgi:hypothetical protein